MRLSPGELGTRSEEITMGEYVKSIEEVSVGDDVSWSAGTDTNSGKVISMTPSTISVAVYSTKLLNGPSSGEPDALKFSPGGFVGHTSGTPRYEYFLEPSASEFPKKFSRRKDFVKTKFDEVLRKRVPATEDRFKMVGTSSRGSMRGWGVLYFGRNYHYGFNF